jgi:hypothetical protein
MIDHIIIFYSRRAAAPQTAKRTSVARRASVRQFIRAGGQNPFRDAIRVQLRRAPTQFDADAVLTRPWCQIEHPGKGVTWSR